MPAGGSGGASILRARAKLKGAATTLALRAGNDADEALALPPIGRRGSLADLEPEPEPELEGSKPNSRAGSREGSRAGSALPGESMTFELDALPDAVHVTVRPGRARLCTLDVSHSASGFLWRLSMEKAGAYRLILVVLGRAGGGGGELRQPGREVRRRYLLGHTITCSE